MRKQKQEQLVESAFWTNFFYFNLPAHINQVPEHINRANFRHYHAGDDDMKSMAEYVKSIDQLDLDDTDITIEGIKHLNKLERISNLRLKECRYIDDAAMPSICSLKGIKLLHLKGTAVTTAGFEHIKNLTELKTLLISADFKDPKLEEIFVSLAKDCVFIVNYKAFPFLEEH